MDKNFIKMYLLALALTASIAGVSYIFYYVGMFNSVLFVTVAGFLRIGYVLYKDLLKFKERRY